ncbi:MAG: CRTAC1 family protein [Longimicrobiales bacterium]
MRRPMGRALTVALLTAACAPGEPELEPVAFAPLQVAAFADGNTLTDAWADFDGDGDPDRFVGFNGDASRLYRNGGAGEFADAAAELGLVVTRRVRTSAWGDFDADGDPDLLLGFAPDSLAPGVLALWRNEGGTAFTEVGADVGLALDSVATRQASWVDYDADGDVDLFLAFRDAPNRLWRNDAGAFVDVSGPTGIGDPRRSVGAVWFDADEDGDLDVYVTNMDGDANGMWVNEGERFYDRAEAWGLADGGRALGDAAQGSVRPCVVDYDRDGHLDLFTANYGTNGLFRNPGPGARWENVADSVGLAENSHFDTCAWADFDHDGWPDLYVNGTVTGGVSYRDFLYRRQAGRFADVTPPELLVEADHGATWVDYDRDGDLDLALTGTAEGATHALMQNLLRPEAAFHSVKVIVLDAQGRANQAGAEVRVFVAGTFELLGSALVDTGSGYDAQNLLPVHFGLPGAQPVDIEVTLVGGGKRITTRAVGVDPSAWRGKVIRLPFDEEGKLMR